MMNQNGLNTLSKFFFFLSLPFALYGEESKKSLLEKMMSPKVSLESTLMERGAVDDTKGAVQVHKNSLKINNSMASFGYTNWKFDWEDVSDLPFGDKIHQPIEEMHRLNFSLSKAYRINERWFSLSSASVSSTFEETMDNAYSFGLFSFASYAINRDHTLQVGVFGNYHPVSSLILPIASYSYRANQKEGIEVIVGFPRTHVGYHVNPDTLLRLGVTFSNSLIRLSDNSPVEAGGFNEFQDYMGNLGVSYTISDKIKLKGDLLYAVKRDITTYNKDGREMNSYEIEPTAGIMFNLIVGL